VAHFSVLTSHPRCTRAVPPGFVQVFNRLPRGKGVLRIAGSSIRVIIEGEMTYEIDGQIVTVRAGELLYIGPGSPCSASNHAAVSGISVSLRPRPLAALANEDRILGRHVVLSTKTSPLGRILENYAYRLMRVPEEGPGLADAVVSHLRRAVEAALAESRIAIEQLAASRASTRREIFRRLERARGHLYSTPERFVPLDELSNIAGLSKFHFVRQFRLAFGVSPSAYHRQLRLDAAQASGARPTVDGDWDDSYFGYSSARSFRRALQRQPAFNDRQGAV
jgi:AraC-like DNA-binding protein